MIKEIMEWKKIEESNNRRKINENINIMKIIISIIIM